MQSIFEILLLVGNPGKISKGEKAFLKENLICYISQERKVVKSSNLVKLVFSSAEIFWEKNRAKKFPT